MTIYINLLTLRSQLRASSGTRASDRRQIDDMLAQVIEWRGRVAAAPPHRADVFAYLKTLTHP
jgi:hypothetical protein